MKFKGSTLHIFFLYVLVALACQTYTLAAQKPADTPEDGGVPPTKPIEFEAFLNRLFTAEMSLLGIPGSSFILVKDSDVFFSKGWGFANIEEARMIDPITTLFPMHSVADLLVATAVMQLVDQGKLALDDDAGKHLGGIELDPPPDTTLTIRNLLAGTSGLSSDRRGIHGYLRYGIHNEYTDPEIPRPAITTPPGESFSHSGYGYYLLTRVVESVSGVPLRKYVSENIFEPLGMKSSTLFLQTSQLGNLASGYTHSGGSFGRTSRIAFSNPETLSPIATSYDIARFMICLVNGGRLNGVELLSPEGTHTLLERQFSFRPGLPGSAMALTEHHENGERVLFVTSGVLGFYNAMYLFPDRGMGIFIAYNRFEPVFASHVLTAFLDRYYPHDTMQSVDFRATADTPDLGSFSGRYRFSNISEEPLSRMGTFLNEIRIKAVPPQSLELRYPFNIRPPVTLYRTGARTFIDPSGGLSVAFAQGSAGSVDRLYIGTSSLSRLPWYQRDVFKVYALGALALVFLSALAEWPFDNIVRRMFTSYGQSPRPMRIARVVGWVMCLLNLIIAGWLLVHIFSLDGYESLVHTHGGSAYIGVLQRLAALATAGTVIFTIAAWRGGYWPLFARTHYTLVAVSAVLFLALLIRWNIT